MATFSYANATVARWRSFAQALKRWLLALTPPQSPPGRDPETVFQTSAASERAVSIARGVDAED